MQQVKSHASTNTTEKQARRKKFRILARPGSCSTRGEQVFSLLSSASPRHQVSCFFAQVDRGRSRKDTDALCPPFSFSLADGTRCSCRGVFFFRELSRSHICSRTEHPFFVLLLLLLTASRQSIRIAHNRLCFSLVFFLFLRNKCGGSVNGLPRNGPEGHRHTARCFSPNKKKM